MPFRRMSPAVALAAVLMSSPCAMAQYYGGGCSSCGTAAPVSRMASCTPIQPVYSTCYQTVPITTYRQEKQTVKVPYYQTAYEDREVTVYEPVTRQRMVEVPTISYQNVVENRVVHRDMGRWQTNYQPIAKCAPCQVDPRPGLMGWLNRTGYAFKSSFTPNYRTTRQYVPSMMACNVPITRQVAVRGTRQVAISETQMVARKKTERREVRKLAYREEEVTVSRPVTAYRTVPIGTSMAYGYGGYGMGGTSTAWILDDKDTQTARRPEPDPLYEDDPLRSAEKTFKDDGPPRTGDSSFERNTSPDNGFRRSSFERELTPPLETTPLQKPLRTFPNDDPNTPPQFEPLNSSQRSHSDRVVPARHSQRSVAVSGGGWKASRNSEEATSTASRGAVAIPGLSMTNQ